MPLKNKKIIFLEGSTEERYINDFCKKHGKLIDDIENSNYEYDIIHMNQLADEYESSYEEFHEIIIVLDNDDWKANKDVETVKVLAKRTGSKVLILQQQPLMETFLAAHFNDFVIDDNWSETELKEMSIQFMCLKFEVDDIKQIKKKMTLTNIKRKGGNYSNASRYKHRFNIMKILVFV